MKVVVVYESLYGSTAAVARAVAQGVAHSLSLDIGVGVRALSTAEAGPGELAGVDLLIAGAPVHSMGLPSEQSRELALKNNVGPAGIAPDLSHPLMRDWLESLPHAGLPGSPFAAAFETRVNAWYGRGAVSKILQGLEHRGYRPIAKGVGFFVSGSPLVPTANGVLNPGEIERARQWGIELASKINIYEKG